MLHSHKRILVFVIPLIILTACASTPTAQPAITTQTPDSPGLASPQEAPSLLAALTANNVNVTVSGVQIAEKALQKFETLNVTAGNRILIDKSGRGVMRFGDRHEIDLFGDTEVVLDEAKVEPGGSTFLRLRQVRGHTHTLLNPQSIARVTLETADSTMTTLEQGTEFAVCFAPDKVTCIVVKEGSLEVTSQGSKQIYRKGEFTFYEPGQPPQAPNCIRPEEFDEWLISKQGPSDAVPLSQLVASWPQQPCPPDSPTVENTPTVKPPEMICETFESGFSLGQMIGSHPDWFDGDVGPSVNAGIGSGGSSGLTPGENVFIWAGHPFDWNAPDFQGLTLQMDFQTNEEGKFNDDRIGWTINNADINSDFVFGVQLDPGGTDQNIEAYWDGDTIGDDGGRSSITNLPALPANAWYRLRANISKLTATSARIDVSLTELDAGGNPGGVVASGSIPDTSLLPNTPENELPNLVYFTGPIWPAFKNFSYAAGSADNACYQVHSGAPIQPPAATLPPTLAPEPTATLIPTVPPQPTIPPTPYVLIKAITIDQSNQYVVEYETFGYTEQLPGMHVHFFFNTVPPEQAGVPGSGPWILYGGPRPFTQYTVHDRPAEATQMCALVANADHSVQLNTGNCVDLP